MFYGMLHVALVWELLLIFLKVLGVIFTEFRFLNTVSSPEMSGWTLKRKALGTHDLLSR
jgi:hypothetical protein